ncbi:hypothetical protein NBRC116587_20140 [Pseudoteredinibacter isoporae]
MVVTPFGIVTELRLLEKKVPVSIVVRLFDRVIDVKSLFIKAPLPMLVTLSGITTEPRLFDSNAFAPI